MLTTILNIPLEKREKMKAIIEDDEEYEYALEIAMEWWIRNKPEASWTELISAVYRCGENNAAGEMRKTFGKYVLYLWCKSKCSTFGFFVVWNAFQAIHSNLMHSYLAEAYLYIHQLPKGLSIVVNV